MGHEECLDPERVWQRGLYGKGGYLACLGLLTTFLAMEIWHTSLKCDDMGISYWTGRKRAEDQQRGCAKQCAAQAVMRQLSILVLTP